MIVLINSPAYLNAADVGLALAGRFAAGAEDAAGGLVDLEDLLSGALPDTGGSLEQRLHAAVHERVRALKEGGRADVVVVGAFYEPEPLGRLRRVLSDLDDVIYAFRPRHGADDLARAWDTGDGEQLCELLALHDQWRAAQEQGARRGDMGFEVAVSRFDPRAVADALWEDIHQPVELVDPDPAWPARFASERGRIQAALGDLALSVEHVGSTAVPGLRAKPIIDILVTVGDLERDAVRCFAPLSGLSYAFVDYPQNTDRRFLRKGQPRSHHIQIVEHGGAAGRAYLAFRDALRTDVTLREEYARLKQAARAELARDRAEYGARKSALIRRALETGSSR